MDSPGLLDTGSTEVTLGFTPLKTGSEAAAAAEAVSPKAAPQALKLLDPCEVDPPRLVDPGSRAASLTAAAVEAAAAVAGTPADSDGLQWQRMHAFMNHMNCIHAQSGKATSIWQGGTPGFSGT